MRLKLVAAVAAAPSRCCAFCVCLCEPDWITGVFSQTCFQTAYFCLTNSSLNSSLSNYERVASKRAKEQKRKGLSAKQEQAGGSVQALVEEEEEVGEEEELWAVRVCCKQVAGLFYAIAQDSTCCRWLAERTLRAKVEEENERSLWWRIALRFPGLN